MADVKIIDIDSEQWNMKDQNARDRLAELETGNKIQNIETTPSSNVTMELITITNVKFLQITFTGFLLNLQSEQNILSFTNNFGLNENFYFLVDADKVSQTGRVPVIIGLLTSGIMQTYPIVIDNWTPNLGQCRLYGQALIKIG